MPDIRISKRSDIRLCLYKQRPDTFLNLKMSSCFQFFVLQRTKNEFVKSVKMYFSPKIICFRSREQPNIRLFDQIAIRQNQYPVHPSLFKPNQNMLSERSGTLSGRYGTALPIFFVFSLNYAVCMHATPIILKSSLLDKQCVISAFQRKKNRTNLSSIQAFLQLLMYSGRFFDKKSKKDVRTG